MPKAIRGGALREARKRWKLNQSAEAKANEKQYQKDYYYSFRSTGRSVGRPSKKKK